MFSACAASVRCTRHSALPETSWRVTVRDLPVYLSGVLGPVSVTETSLPAMP
jgi:hypothetical protein